MFLTPTWSNMTWCLFSVRHVENVREIVAHSISKKKKKEETTKKNKAKSSALIKNDSTTEDWASQSRGVDSETAPDQVQTALICQQISTSMKPSFSDTNPTTGRCCRRVKGCSSATLGGPVCRVFVFIYNKKNWTWKRSWQPLFISFFLKVWYFHESQVGETVSELDKKPIFTSRIGS